MTCSGSGLRPRVVGTAGSFPRCPVHMQTAASQFLVPVVRLERFSAVAWGWPVSAGQAPRTRVRGSGPSCAAPAPEMRWLQCGQHPVPPAQLSLGLRGLLLRSALLAAPATARPRGMPPRSIWWLFQDFFKIRFCDLLHDLLVSTTKHPWQLVSSEQVSPRDSTASSRPAPLAVLRSRSAGHLTGRAAFLVLSLSWQLGALAVSPPPLGPKLCRQY